VREAQNKGLPIRTSEEERELFRQSEEQQRKRLLEIITRRSQPQESDPNYRLGPQDELEINVFDVPELNVTAQVSQSGFLQLPLIGAVRATGLTEAELADELRKRLRTYVISPQVSVTVTQYASQKVNVMGAVSKPGAIALKKGSNSLLEVLSQAGGITDKAGNFVTLVPAELSAPGNDASAAARARLALGESGSAVRPTRGIEIYLDQIIGTSGGIPIDVPIRAGDLVVVPEAGKVMVEGEVQKPGSYDLSQQLTLLGALAAAGGITYGADVSEVEVIREASSGEKAYLVLSLEKIGSGGERDVRLRNGDVVRVPSSPGRRLGQDTFEGITKLINVGIGGSVPLAP